MTGFTRSRLRVVLDVLVMMVLVFLGLVTGFWFWWVIAALWAAVFARSMYLDGFSGGRRS
jgi:hypothetical protein